MREYKIGEHVRHIQNNIQSAYREQRQHTTDENETKIIVTPSTHTTNQAATHKKKQTAFQATRG